MDWNKIKETVLGWLTTTGIKILVALLVLIVAFTLINRISKQIEKRSRKQEETKHVDKTVYRTLGYIAKIGLKILVVLSLVAYLGIDTGAITALIASLGVGVGLGVRMGGASGGDDALAMSIEKLTGIGIQWVYLVEDLIVLTLSLSYIPLRRIAYSLLTVILSGQLIGLVAKKKPAAPDAGAEPAEE